MPISILLDYDIRDELEAQAHACGIGLASLLREPAPTTAREARRTRIHQASAEVGRHVQVSPDARAFYEGCATPQADGS